MNRTRRATLLAAGTGLSGLAGCLEQPGASAGADDEPTELVDVEFETGVSVDERLGDDPTIHHDGDEIRVTGTYSIGDACYDERLEEPRYSDESGELRIRVSREHDGRDVCEDEDQLVSYRVVVAFEGAPPDRVEANERPGGTTRTTIE